MAELTKQEILEQITSLLADNENGEISEKDVRDICTFLLEYRSNLQDGKNTYELAVDNGFIGSLSDYLTSLKGAAFVYSDFTPEQLQLLKGAAFVYSDFTPEQLQLLKGDAFVYSDFTPEQLQLLKGDAFVYSDFTPEQLQLLKGAAFVYSDFTPEQIESLKVKGDQGVSVTNIELQNTSGLVKSYRITLSNNNTFDFDVKDGDKGDQGDKLTFSDLTTPEKESLKQQRLIDITEITTAKEFSNTDDADWYYRLNHSGNGSLAISFNDNLPNGWHCYLRQIDIGKMHFLGQNVNPVRNGFLKETENKGDFVHCVIVGHHSDGSCIVELDGDLKKQ